MTSEEGVEQATTAMEEVISWLVAEGATLEDCVPVKDFGVKMFKIGQQLGLSGIDYKTFDAAGKRIKGFD